MKPSQRKDYLERVLALDPLRDAQAIVDLRAVLLADRLPSRSTSNPRRSKVSEDRDARRKRVVERLRKVCTRFYDLPGEKLHRALEQLAKTDEPDLRQWAVRLQRAASARPALERLRGDPKITARFSDRVRELVTAPPHEARRLALRQLDKTGSRVGRQVAKRVRTRYRQVHALAPDYFNRMAMLKRERKLSGAAVAGGGFLTVWVVIQLVRLIVKLVNE